MLGIYVWAKKSIIFLFWIVNDKLKETSNYVLAKVKMWSVLFCFTDQWSACRYHVHILCSSCDNLDVVGLRNTISKDGLILKTMKYFWSIFQPTVKWDASQQCLNIKDFIM